MADETSTPRNRRERRAAAKADGTFKAEKLARTSATSASHLDRLPEIEYRKPPSTAARTPGTKTLYEIAAERQEELKKEGFYDKYDDKYTYGENASDHQFWTGAGDEDEPIGALGEAAVWSVSLAMFHFTLDVLVFHQYRQSIEWKEIWTRVFTIVPALFLVIYILHVRSVMRWARTRQVFFFVASIVAGCYLIKSGNQKGYYAVMKQAPPLGTVWVWSVVEMDLWWSVTHVAVVCGYMWWNGFKTF